MSEKKILDATCGSRSIWFNKHHPAAVYMDKRQEFETRIWKSGDGLSERTLTVDPDIVADFTDIPFPDETFEHVVFDPPHIQQAGETAWIIKKYGKLNDDWPEMLRDGFMECMRVLRTNGVLSSGLRYKSRQHRFGKQSDRNLSSVIIRERIVRPFGVAL